MAECWLYIYENRSLNSIYIGIADSMSRVYQRHNSAAEKLRDASGSVILQTVTPFSSRKDARKAEAIAIHITTLGNVSVAGEDDEGLPLSSTNISGVNSTKELGPAILTKDGSVPSGSFVGTLFVPIHANQLEGRAAPFGAHPSAFFAERARQYWQITEIKRSRITRLVAVLKGNGNVILGDWDVESDGEWTASPDDQTRVTIPLVNPDLDDPRSVKGMRIEGHRLNSGVTYSADLK